MSANFAACAVLVRNAQNRILDWLSWHLSLGFRHICVIDAGSTDQTAHIVQSLTRQWPITYHAPTLSSEMTAEERRQHLTEYALNTLISEEEWIIVFDSDEFCLPHPNLSSLLERGQHAAGIALNWCIYGTEREHRHISRKSLVSSYHYRAHTDLPDHQFVRLLVRSSYLTEPHHDTMIGHLNIPTERLITSQGKPFEKENIPDWEGGRILHYICPAAPGTKEMTPALRKYFDRNDIKDPVPQNLLMAARQTCNELSYTLLMQGIHTLQNLATETTASQNKSSPEPDFNLPNDAQRPGFAYQRVRPSPHEQKLLTPQVAPPYQITRAFLLRSSGGVLLKADPAGSGRPLIAFIQEQYPRLISLTSQDKEDFVLGDIPCIHGMSTFISNRTHHAKIFSLPEASERAGIFFEAIPLPDIEPPAFLPLPPTDKKEGLSLTGLLAWLSTHSDTNIDDIRRALQLLAKKDATELKEKIPELQQFLS